MVGHRAMEHMQKSTARIHRTRRGRQLGRPAGPPVAGSVVLACPRGRSGLMLRACRYRPWRSDTRCAPRRGGIVRRGQMMLTCPIGVMSEPLRFCCRWCSYGERRALGSRPESALALRR
jgi:hypothetical protein